MDSCCSVSGLATAYLHHLRVLVDEFLSLSLRGNNLPFWCQQPSVHVRLGEERGDGGGLGQAGLDAGCPKMPSCHPWEGPGVRSNKEGSRARFRNKRKGKKRTSPHHWTSVNINARNATAAGSIEAAIAGIFEATRRGGVFTSKAVWLDYSKASTEGPSQSAPLKPGASILLKWPFM